MLVGVVDGRARARKPQLAQLHAGRKSGTSRRTVGKHGYGAANTPRRSLELFPAGQPQYVIIVKLNNPKGDIFGGSTAAPVSKIVLQAALAASDAALDRSALATSESMSTVADTTVTRRATWRAPTRRRTDDTLPPVVARARERAPRPRMRRRRAPCPTCGA